MFYPFCYTYAKSIFLLLKETLPSIISVLIEFEYNFSLANFWCRSVAREFIFWDYNFSCVWKFCILLWYIYIYISRWNFELFLNRNKIFMYENRKIWRERILFWVWGIFILLLFFLSIRISREIYVISYIGIKWVHDFLQKIYCIRDKTSWKPVFDCYIYS